MYIYFLSRTQILASKDAAIRLVCRLFRVLTGKLGFKVEILKLSISVLLCSLCRVEDLVSEKKVEADVITTAFGRCQSALQEWVKHAQVIGGSFFGGHVSQFSWNSSVEFKVFVHHVAMY